MARIAGVNLPNNKRVEIALRYIYGVGPTRAKLICDQLHIETSKRVFDLTEEDLLEIRNFIDKNVKVEGDLRREVSLNIKRHLDMGSYRGIRHRKRLPVRGQNTKSNARTRKGKRTAPVAGKKK